MQLNWNEIFQKLIFCSIPGFFAGLVLFIFSFSHNYYRNNKYIAKLLIEIIGATITSTFIASFFNTPFIQIVVAFCVGLGWTKVIQSIRSKITAIIEALISNKIS